VSDLSRPPGVVPLPQEIIRAKREGAVLERAQIDAFAAGLADGSWSDAQAGAMAMALFLNELTERETVDLTEAMTRSGTVLDWRGRFDGPVLDKHSTGGVGDKVSLVLAPIVAACGGFIPMISGRGLGHTGGTLDKLESIPGFRTQLGRDEMERVIRTAGFTIVGASADLAPADRKLYAIRDVTATVDSIPLICASILSKKRAAGLEALVLDVKAGNGAFAPDLHAAHRLALALTRVAARGGLPTVAWVTDMNEVLGTTVGNSVEVLESMRFLRGEGRDARLAKVTETLAAEMLVVGRLAPDLDAGRAQVRQAVVSGAALERFARMLVAQGGPTGFVDHPERFLPVAPVRRDLHAAADGWITQVATREVGLALIALGGGRRRDSDAIDPRVGFTAVAPIGQRVAKGDVLAVIHAATESDADVAAARLQSLVRVGSEPPKLHDVLVERVAAPPAP